MISGLGYRAYGEEEGIMDQGLARRDIHPARRPGFRIKGLEFVVYGLWYRGDGSQGFMVHGLGFGVCAEMFPSPPNLFQGLGFRVEG